MTINSSAIEVKGLIKTYPSGESRIAVLDDLNVRFESGKLNYIVGPSGCGKTTLVSVIGAMLAPDEGSVVIDGTEITKMQEAERTAYRARNIGFMFQQFQLIHTLSVCDNVASALFPLGASWHEAHDAAMEMLKTIDLAVHADSRIGTLSGGQQQRTALARSLLKKPRVLICDEPTASLDGDTGYKTMNLIREAALRDNRIVLVVTHDSRIFDLADQIYMMKNGKIEVSSK